MTKAKLGSSDLAKTPLLDISKAGRKRWLGSASAMAAAIALTGVLPAPVMAQTAAQMPARTGMDPSVVRGIPGSVRQINLRASRETAAPPTVTTRPSPVQSIPTPILAERMMIERGITRGTPVTLQPVNNNVEPIINTLSIGPTPTPPQTTASSTPATMPGDTNVAGINVLAEANYFSSDIDFKAGAAEDVIEIFGTQAIINWLTFTSGSAGSTVDFLPSGANLRFNSTQTDFTVLNRIFTPGIDSAIRIDGNVSSTVLNGAAQGGSVWFYSPGGIVVGPTARFDVGSLILTSSEIDAISSTVNFLGVAEPDTSVIIESGAVINADDSVIMLAPRVEQGGTVRSQGNIAYIGAEQAEVTLANGLFGISVLVGTDDANGIVHTGTTGGGTPNDNPARAITMDTFSKTSAVTMLLGGNIGYDDASVATASNGVIILTAADGAVAGSGNIEVGAAQFDSSAVFRTSGDLTLAVDGQGSEINFGSSGQQADFIALSSGDISVSATSGGNIAVNGDFRAIASTGETGGTITITVDDAGRNDDSSFSGLIVNQDIELNVSAVGIDDTNTGGIGGDAAAGTININATQGGEILAGLDFEMIAEAQAGYGLAQAGSATGGTVNVTLDGVNTRVGGNGFVSVAVDAAAAVDPLGSFDPIPPEIGNNSVGGAVNFNLNDGLLAGLALSISANATATSGDAAFNARSYDGTGGSVTIDSGANLDFGNIVINADGQGGEGGRGGFFEDGSVGGVGTGGSISITSSDNLESLIDLTLSARGTGGAGGEGGFSGTGGAGGAGIGGDISFSVSGSGAVLANLADGQIDTGAQGGAGGTGGTEASLTDSGNGGAGGNAAGGASSFTLGGVGASYTLNSDQLVMTSDAVGGAGGNGALNFSGLNAGNGGAGGSAVGGTVSADVLSGATLSLSGLNGPFAFAAIGVGGDGGDGGGIDMLGGGFAGNGGTGGDGTGGSPRLIATGGTITGTAAFLDATGVGGTGGTGGDDGLTIIGEQGNGGAGSGGAPIIQTFDGSPGIITLGDVTVTATSFGGGGTVTGSTLGGQITITDGSADAAGLITLGSLTVDATGSVGTGAGLLSISSGSGPITVTGAVSADVTGDIAIALDGSGQMIVGGSATLNASGDINLAHANNTGDVSSLNAAGGFTATAGGDFAAGAGSNIDSGFFVTISGQNVAYDDIFASGVVNLTSTTGSITGTSTGTVSASAAVDAINLLSAADITFGNLVTLNGNIDIDAVGDIVGVDANSEQFINVDSTGIPAGLIDIDAVTSGSLATINGGTIDIETFNPGFIASVTSSVGDINIAAINSASIVGLDSAAAIVLGNATSGGLSFSATAVTDVTIGTLVTTGNVADVGITAGGTATYTSIDGDRLVTINAASIIGGDISVDATVRLNGGVVDIGAIIVDELGNIDIDATTGDLSTGALSGNAVSANAFGNLATGEINAVSTGLGAGGNAVLGNINTGGLSIGVTGDLDAGIINGTSTVAISFVTVGGDANIESLSIDNLMDLNITGALTGGVLSGASLVTIDADSVDVTTVNSDSQSVTIRAAAGDAAVGTVNSGFASTITATLGDVQVGSVNSGTGATLTGENVSLDSGDVGGTLRLNATAGDVSGTGAINVAGAIDLDATGNIGFGTLNAGTTFNANAGGALTFVSSSAGSTTNFTAGGDIGFTSLGGDNTVTLNAAGAINGGIVDTDQLAASSTFTAGNSITLGDVTTRILTVNAGTDITLGAVDALGRDIRGIAIDLDAGGDIAFTSLASGRGIQVGSATVSGGDIVSDNGVALTAEAITLGDVSVTELGGVTLQTTAADLTVGNVVSNTFGITLDAATALTAGNLSVTGTANSSDINITAGTNATIGDVAAGNQLGINAAGNLIAGNLVSNVVSPGTTITVGGDAAIASFDALLGAATLTVGGALTGGSFAANSALILGAADIDIAQAISRAQSITATASTGDAVIGDAQAALDLTVTASNGSPTLGAFAVGNDLSLTGASILLGGGVVDGDLSLQALLTDITISLDGTESIVVDGQTTLTSDGNIVVTHTNNAAGTASIDSTGLINATAFGSIDAQAGSRIVSAATVSMRAEGNIGVDDVAGVGAVSLSAAGNVDVNNASVTGAPVTINLGAGTLVAGPQLLIDAGLDNPVSGSYDPAFDATITGLVTSTGTIAINAGGNAVFAGGSSTISDNGLSVLTGDDIIIAQGASLVAGANPATTPNAANPFADFNNLVLNAGGVAPLFSTPFTPIASIVSDGTIDANGFAVIMSANAIDALDGTIIASSAAIDINDAPSDAVIAAIGQSDDNGLLSANCLQGNICIGNIQADNQLLIGQASNNNAVALFIEQGTVDANDILITTRNDIVMGTNGIATTLNGANTFSAISLTGDVNLLDASITSGQILIEAAGSLTGTGVLTSANDIGITVGQDLIAGSIITDGQLTDVVDVGGALEASYNVAGSADIDVLSIGAGDVSINAGDTVRIGTVIVPGTNIALSGGTLAQLDFTNTAVDVSLDGGSVVLGQVTAIGNVFADSSSSVDLTNIDAGAGISITAVTAVTGGDLTAAATAQVDAASIALGTVDANAIVLNSASDILFNSLNSPTAITLTATGGTIGANTGSGDVNSGGAVSLSAQAIDIGNVLASGGVDLTATAGSITVGDVTNAAIGASIGLNAAGGTGDIAAGALTTNSGDILISAGRDISLVSARTGTGTPTAGSIGMLSGRDASITGTLDAGEDILVRSLGNASLNIANAGDDIVIDAAGAVTLTSATTTGAGIDLFSLITDDGSAGQAGAILFAGEALTGSGINLNSGSDITVTGTLNANDAISVVATGTPTIGNAISGGDTVVRGAAVTFNNGTIGGRLSLISDSGAIDGNGNVDVAGAIDFASAAGITFGTLNAAGGDFDLNAAGDISFDAASALVNIDFRTTGQIVGGDLTAGSAVTLDGASIAIGDVSGEFIGIISGADILFDSLTSPNLISLNAATGTIGANTGPGDIDSGDDVDLAAQVISVGNVTAGGSVTADASAGDAAFAVVDAVSDITITATGTPSLTNAISGGNTSITGGSVSFDNGTIGGDLILISSAGGIGGDGAVSVAGAISLNSAAGVTFGALNAAGGDFNVIAAGDIVFGAATALANVTFQTNGAIQGGDVTAGSAITLDAANIILGDVNGALIGLSSGSDILFDSIVSPNAITLTAANGTIGANTGVGDIDSGGAVSLNAQAIDIGNVTAVGLVDVSASAGSLSAGDVSVTATGSGIALRAAGIGRDIAAGALTTNSGDILVSAGRDIAVTSAFTGPGAPTAGSIGMLSGGDTSVTGALAAGEDIAIRSLGSVNMGTATAGDDIVIEADGAISITSATTTGSGIDLFALSFDDGAAGESEFTQFDAETFAGSGISLLSGANLTVTGALSAFDTISVGADGTASVGDAVSGGDTAITGAAVALANGAIDGDLSLTATAGDIDGSGTVNVSGGISLDAAGSIGFASLASQNGDFNALAGADIVFGEIDSSQAVDLRAGGLIFGDLLNAVTAVTMTAAGSITVDHAEAGTDLTAIAGGNFTTGLNSIITGGDITIVGDVVDLGNSTAGGLIDVLGSQIDFVNLIAGSTVALQTSGSSPVGLPTTGNLNITGTNITAGSGASSLDAAGSIALSGATNILGSLSMSALGDIAFGTALVEGGDFAATAGGAIDLTTAQASGLIDFLAGLDLTATGAITGSTGVVLESSDGAVFGTDIFTGGDIGITAAATVTLNDLALDFGLADIVAGGDVTVNDILAAGQISIASGGALTFGNLDAADSAALSSQGATVGQTIAAGTTIDADAGAGGFTIGDMFAGTQITINSAGLIAATSMTSDGAIDLTSTGAGDVTATAINAGTDVAITTAGAFAVGELNAAQSGSGDAQVQADAGIVIGTLRGITSTLRAASGAVAVTDDASLTGLLDASGQSVFARASGSLFATADATDGNVDLAAAGDLAAQGISANGDVILQSGASVTVNEATTANGGTTALPPGTQGPLQITTINGGDITITAGTDILITSLVEAAGALSMTAGASIDIQALASGAQVDTLSSDINIGAAGALGRSDLTTRVSIATEGDIQLGGAAGTSTGFELDNAEFSRIHSGGDVIISALGVTTGEGNINVGDLDVLVGVGTGTPVDGNISSFGGLVLEADNNVNVTGGLIVSGATPDNVLAIDAANLITIDAETATVQIGDGAGSLSGDLEFNADTVIAANTADLASILALGFADAEALLGQAAAAPRPDGYILGSSIFFNVDSGVLIQNSGAGSDFDERRGVVANSVFVSSPAPDVGIVINGVLDTFTGLDAVALVETPTDFDPLSTVNGCLIADPASCAVIVTPPVVNPPIDSGPVDGPIRDLIDDQVEEESPVVETVSTLLIEMRKDPEQQEDPLLDEPVTGAGNEDFWVTEDEDEEEEGEEELEPAE